MKNTWLLIFAFTFVTEDNCQRVVYPEETEYCRETIGSDAYCVQITECPAAKDNIKRGKTPVTCGFSGEIPLVCCLVSVVPTEPKITPDVQCGRTANADQIDEVTYRNDSYDQDKGIERIEVNSDGTFVIQPRILNSEKFRVSSGEWPWMIAIYLKSNGSFICNGFIIDSSHLLTAAHCFYGKRRQLQDYYIGTIHNEEILNVEVTELQIHHRYEDNYYKDIALLKISPRLTDVVSICMPSGVNESNYLLEKEITVLDWVGTEYVTQLNRIAEIQLCNQLYTNLTNSPFPSGITDELICAIPKEESDNVCLVHSGGPVMIVENGKWVALGIASFGIPCTLPNYPAVYTRISPFLQWIRDKE